MSMSDPLGDMLARIKNAQRAKKSDVVSPASRLRENVLEVLKREGYIAGYEKNNVRPGIDELRIQLKYYEGSAVITEIYRVSTPGRRVYSSVKDLPRVYNGLGISILSARSVTDLEKTKQILLFPLEESVHERSFYIVYSKNRILKPHVRQFMHYVQNFYQ